MVTSLNKIHIAKVMMALEISDFQSDRSRLAHPLLAGSNTDMKEDNLVPMTLATPKDTWDTCMIHIHFPLHQPRMLTIIISGAPRSDDRGLTSSSEQIPYGSNQSYYEGQEPEGAPVDPNAPEGERGIGGTVLGGAAGYYVGHKQNHGLLGALGGAIVGNIVGDKISDGRHHHDHNDRHDRREDRRQDRYDRRQERHDRHDFRHGRRGFGGGCEPGFGRGFGRGDFGGRGFGRGFGGGSSWGGGW